MRTGAVGGRLVMRPSMFWKILHCSSTAQTPGFCASVTGRTPSMLRRSWNWVLLRLLGATSCSRGLSRAAATVAKAVEMGSCAGGDGADTGCPRVQDAQAAQGCQHISASGWKVVDMCWGKGTSDLSLCNGGQVLLGGASRSMNGHQHVACKGFRQ